MGKENEDGLSHHKLKTLLVVVHGRRYCHAEEGRFLGGLLGMP